MVNALEVFKDCEVSFKKEVAAHGKRLVFTLGECVADGAQAEECIYVLEYGLCSAFEAFSVPFQCLLKSLLSLLRSAERLAAAVGRGHQRHGLRGVRHRLRHLPNAWHHGAGGEPLRFRDGDPAEGLDGRLAKALRQEGGAFRWEDLEARQQSAASGGHHRDLQ